MSTGQKRRQRNTRQLEGLEWIALREIIEVEPWLYIDEYQHRMFLKTGAKYSYTAIRRAFQANGYTHHKLERIASRRFAIEQRLYRAKVNTYVLCEHDTIIHTCSPVLYTHITYSFIRIAIGYSTHVFRDEYRYDHNCLIFLDESHVDDRDSRRKKGWALRGLNCVIRETFKRGNPVSVIAALITSGFVMPACCWVEKSKGVDQEIFK